MRDINLFYVLLAFSVALVAFLAPQFFLYLIASLCVYIFVVSVVEAIKDNK